MAAHVETARSKSSSPRPVRARPELRVQDHGDPMKILLPVLAHDGPVQPRRRPPVDVADAVALPVLPVALVLERVAEVGRQRHPARLVAPPDGMSSRDSGVKLGVDQQRAVLPDEVVGAQQPERELRLHPPAAQRVLARAPGRRGAASPAPSPPVRASAASPRPPPRRQSPAAAGTAARSSPRRPAAPGLSPAGSPPASPPPPTRVGVFRPHRRRGAGPAASRR